MLDIKGKIVLVTGGAHGLGLAIAKSLYANGAIPVIADKDESALAELKEIDCYPLDVTRPEMAKSVCAEIVKCHGNIDALVNNAGVIYSEPMVNIMNPNSMMHDYDRFCDSLKVNLHSVFIMTSAVVEQMVLKRTKGVVINISSISGSGNEGQTAYSAAKAAVNAMTVTWSKELAKLGIRCNAVAPGFIGTESTSSALHEEIIRHIKSNTPLRRLGLPEEVASAVLSVMQNDFINGALIPVNGGLTI